MNTIISSNTDPSEENSWNEITKINAASQSFDFLNDEPEIYSLADVKKK